LYENQAYGKKTEVVAKSTVNLVSWMISLGQKYAAPLIYAPLPKAAALAAQKRLHLVKFNGKAL
jgi:hypothetical protein